MSVPKLKIKRFNPNILELRRLRGSPPTIVVIGKRASGKSTLIKDLMYYMRDIPMFVAMSGTEEGNGFYSNFIHPLCVHNEYKQNIVSDLINKQKLKMMKCRKAEIDPDSRPDLGMGLLLDDCGYDKGIMKQKEMRLLFMNGRHWKICFIVSLQYMMGMPPDLRTNIDFVFCLRENISANQKRLYENFFGCFKKLSHFQDTFNAFTNNYECLVLDNTSKSTNIEDCVFSYRAQTDLEYRIGSPALWKYMDSIYNKNYDIEDEDENERKKASSVNIKRGPMVEIVDKSRKY